MVTIKFNSILKRYNENKDIAVLNIKSLAVIKDILNTFNIIPGEIGVILLNSKLVSEEAKVKDGDTIELFPVFGGG